MLDVGEIGSSRVLGKAVEHQFDDHVVIIAINCRIKALANRAFPVGAQRTLASRLPGACVARRAVSRKIVPSA
jgi:hypothetical protein